MCCSRYDIVAWFYLFDAADKVKTSDDGQTKIICLSVMCAVNLGLHASQVSCGLLYKCISGQSKFLLSQVVIC